MFMIRLQQLKLNIDHTEADLRRKLLKTLRVKEDALLSYQIEKQSLDARKKPQLSYVYTVAVHLKNEKEFLKKNRNANIQAASENRYHMDVSGTEALRERPVIVGSGPAGLFCAYMLAKSRIQTAAFGTGNACGTAEKRCREVLGNSESRSGIKRTVR